MGRVTPNPDIARRLAEVSLPSAEDESTRVGDLWEDKALVLVHLRHFGCILCRHFAARLGEEYRRLTDADVRVVAIGTGGRVYAAEFARMRRIRYTILVDKHLQSHDIIGNLSGPSWGILAPKVLREGLRALAAGERQGKTGPHPWVFGAAHVFAKGGHLRYAWLNENYHDNPPLEELVAEGLAAAKSDA